MATPFDNAAVRYLLAASSAAILVFVAFTFLDGTMRLLVLGMAVLELLVVPQVFRLVAEQGPA